LIETHVGLLCSGKLDRHRRCGDRYAHSG
jgi:hypothetical protein